MSDLLNAPLSEVDPLVSEAIDDEVRRQAEGLELIASENFVSEAVLEAMGSVFTNKYAEGYVGKRYYGGCEFTDVVEQAAIDRAKEIFGAEHANVQPHSGSQANMAVYLAALQYGDTILGMNLSHGGHLTHGHPLNFSGFSYKVVEYGVSRETEQIDYDELERLAQEHNPRMIVCGASAYPRTIDFERIGSIARSVGALVFVDAVHYAPHELTDVRAIDCDFLSCSAYKFYGPHVGVLYGKHDLLESVSFPKLQPAPDYAPELAETGTQNHEGMVGAAAAVEFLASLAEGDTRRERLRSSFKALHERGAALAKQLWEGLSSIERVRLYGPTPDKPRTPTISFTVKGCASTEVSRRLVERGIFASHGDFYAATVVERLNLGEEGLVRAGAACYTTDEEIARLVDGVREIARGAN